MCAAIFLEEWVRNAAANNHLSQSTTWPASPDQRLAGRSPGARSVVRHNVSPIVRRRASVVAQLKVMGFAEPVIGPARGPHRARAMGLPRLGPDSLAQPILRADGGTALRAFVYPTLALSF